MRYFIPLICLLFACSNPEIKEVNLIPKPQSITVNEGVFSLGFSTGLITDSTFIDEANYLKELLNLSFKGKKNIIRLSQIEGLKDEAYQLEITKEQLHLSASSNVGLMRGIQTLRQLLPAGYEDKGVVAKIPCLKIHDFPRFSWRGMLLDCCRHFMDKEFVMRYIDLLAYHKMNVLHWHLTEDQGWRIEIEKYPKLTEIGAWRTEKNGEKYGGFYTKAPKIRDK